MAKIFFQTATTFVFCTFLVVVLFTSHNNFRVMFAYQINSYVLLFGDIMFWALKTMSFYDIRIAHQSWFLRPWRLLAYNINKIYGCTKNIAYIKFVNINISTATSNENYNTSNQLFVLTWFFSNSTLSLNLYIYDHFETLILMLRDTTIPTFTCTFNNAFQKKLNRFFLLT